MFHKIIQMLKEESINFSFRFWCFFFVFVFFTFRRTYMIWEENWPLKKPHFKHDIWLQRDSFPLWKVCKLYNRDTGMEEIEGKKLGVFFHSSWWAVSSLAPRGGRCSSGIALCQLECPSSLGPSNCFLTLAFRSGGNAGTLRLFFFWLHLVFLLCAGFLS